MEAHYFSRKAFNPNKERSEFSLLEEADVCEVIAAFTSAIRKAAVVMENRNALCEKRGFEYATEHSLVSDFYLAEEMKKQCMDWVEELVEGMTVDELISNTIKNALRFASTVRLDSTKERGFMELESVARAKAAATIASAFCKGI